MRKMAVEGTTYLCERLGDGPAEALVVRYARDERLLSLEADGQVERLHRLGGRRADLRRRARGGGGGVTRRRAHSVAAQRRAHPLGRLGDHGGGHGRRPGRRRSRHARSREGAAGTGEGGLHGAWTSGVTGRWHTSSMLSYSVARPLTVSRTAHRPNSVCSAVSTPTRVGAAYRGHGRGLEQMGRGAGARRSARRRAVVVSAAADAAGDTPPARTLTLPQVRRPGLRLRHSGRGWRSARCLYGSSSAEAVCV
jgi:hypothetical protein